jgi:uroporphyrinogen-III decarboxylase
MEQFFYLYLQEKDALNRLAARMTPFFEAILTALLSCDAEVIFWGGNYDQNITWPPFFVDEICPWLQRVSERVHSAGKYLLTHTDGENNALLPHYPVCQFDIAESVCPYPMTQCTLAEIRKAICPQATVWGGIPSVAFLTDAFSPQAFETYLAEMFDSIGNGDHLILGVSDNVPPDADLSRLETIKSMVESFGIVRGLS